MGLNKAIEHGKEHRSMEQHNPHNRTCEENLTFQRRKVEEAAKQDVKEFEKENE